ncbi:DUF5412 family protein [Oscillospiraceae bacterium PP1C4]
MRIKKAIARISIVLFAILCLLVVLSLIMRCTLYNYKIIKQVSSPDQKYVAIVFEGNSGATNGYVYRMSVLKNGHTINRFTNGNAFISEYQFTVEWLDDNTLFVNNTAAEIYKQKNKVNGVTIHYNCYR